MRVCLVSNEFAPFHGAGIGTYASLMAGVWAGAGHEVHVLTGAHAGLLEDGPRLRPGVRFHTVESDAPGQVGTWAERYAQGVLSALRRLHAEQPFGYIEFPDYGGEGAMAMWARRSGAGVGGLEGAVLGVRLHTPRRECRALNCESWLDEEGARLDAMEDGAIRRADVLISPSASLLEMVRARLGGGARWPREAVVPYPFDGAAVAELLPEAGGEAPLDAPGSPTVLYYGRLERRKGVHLLVTAARRMLDGGVHARFRFIGGDTLTGPLGSSMRSHLESLAGGHIGTGIVFDPPRPRRGLGGEIRGAAIVCVPSLWENFPNVVLESMALGACVVGSDAGGIGEIIHDGVDGLLFRAGDEADLERVLRGALADDALRRTVAAGAPGRITGLCDPGAVVDQTLAAVEGARTRGPAPGRAGEQSPGGGVSVIVLIDDSADGLAATVGSIVSQGEVVGEKLIVTRGSLGAECADAAAQAGFRVVGLRPCGPGAAIQAVSPMLAGGWVLVVEPGDVIADGAVGRLAAAGDSGASWGASWVGGLGAWEDGSGGITPVGLDRDLLASGAAPGPGLVRLDAAARVGGWDAWLTGATWLADWSIACRLARAGEPWVVVPEVVVTRPGGRGAGPAPVAAMMQMLDSCTGLAADSARAGKIIAGRASEAAARGAAAEAARVELGAKIARIEAALAERAPPPGPRRGVHTEAVYRQRMMEENLRYRLADRVSGVLRAVGVGGTLKALFRGARWAVRRGTGS